LLSSTKNDLEALNTAPVLHPRKGLDQKVTLSERPLACAVSCSLVVFAAVVDPDIVRKDLGGRLISAEKMRDDFSVMGMGLCAHLAGPGKLARGLTLGCFSFGGDIWSFLFAFAFVFVFVVREREFVGLVRG
jgi:hypothetical protein